MTTDELTANEADGEGLTVGQTADEFINGRVGVT